MFRLFARRGLRAFRGLGLGRRKPVWPSIAAAALAPLALSCAAARAADFYAGKTLTLVVSSEAGGGYDVYARLLARHLSAFIPGSPTIVVQNEPGAGGLKAAQELYAVLAKDGTQIGYLRGSNMLDSILGIRGGNIDPSKFEWIGNMAGDTDLCSFWAPSGIRSFNDLLTKQVLVGAAGYGSQGYIFPNAINHVLHTKMKVIAGYQGTGDRILAMEQGELQGNCGMNSSTVTGIYSQLLAEKKLIPVIQSGLRPYPALPDVPLTQSFATTDSQRRILMTIFAQMEISRVFAAPPGAPKDRVDLLRQAFLRVMADPGLIADAKKMGLALNPASGENVAAIVAQMAALSPASKTETRAALGE
jgi:tripartite-type tricarboxylate transporter receptor subunit TctC